MSKFKFRLTLAGAVACAVGLVGCADESPWGNVSGEKGYIDFSLSADSGISTKKPAFRSSEGDTRANDLSNYIQVPSPDDFSIRLEKSDGSYAKTWTSLSDFKSEAASSKFNTGVYTVTAFYGVKGTQEFDSPYFEASETIRVLADETTEVNLTADLKNSMVKINYTDGFKNYMSDYHTNLSTEGKADEIVFNSAETRAAFIEPVNASLTVHFTTKEKGFTSSLNLGQFAPEVKTLHNITLDVTENATGTSTLDVVFDEGLTQETVTIDLTDELLTSQPPVINCVGFENGQTVDMLEGSASDVKLQMNIVGQNVIQNAILTIDCDNYIPGWGKEIDLCNATEQQQAAISAAGISARGFFGVKSEGAFLDLTDYGKSLKNGIYTISLKVVDIQGVVSETASVVLNSLPVTVEMVGEPSIVYGSGRAVLVMDYNGLNPETDLGFQAWNAAGIYENVRIISCEEDMSTRAYEIHRYIYTLELPVTTKSMIMVKVLYRNSNIGEYEVPVIVPAYNVAAVDAFSRFAHLKLEVPDAADPSTLAAVVGNIQLRDGSGNSLNILNRDLGAGVITVSGLAPASTYSIQSNIIGEDNAWNTESLSIQTETELPIVNGEFSSVEDAVESGKINIGGEYEVKVAFITNDYQNYSSYSYTPPSNWATVNALTAYTGSNPRNTWFEVPSSWVEDGKAVIRNVGYNHNGTVPSKSGGQMNTNYYCTNTPSESDLVHAAGEIFLGSYLFNGSESRVDGTAFSSRPSSISFDYSYSLKNGNADNGLAYVEVLDASGNVIGTADRFLIPESSETQNKTININYTKFGGKAATLRLGFKSSNQSNPPIYIPTGSELSEGVTVITSESNRTIATNQYHALATGSVLTIDNVEAHYSDLNATPGNAPKLKSSKSRK